MLRHYNHKESVLLARPHLSREICRQWGLQVVDRVVRSVVRIIITQFQPKDEKLEITYM